MSERRIVVVGSREYPNLDEVEQLVREQERDTIIISGGATGVDSVAVTTAQYYRMPYEVYPAHWSKHGRSAGAIRNREMVDNADEVVAFWDGKSRGTKITIDYAKAQGKPLRVIQRTCPDGRVVAICQACAVELAQTLSPGAPAPTFGR